MAGHEGLTVEGSAGEEKDVPRKLQGRAAGFIAFALYGTLGVAGVALAFGAHSAPFFPGDLELASAIQSSSPPFLQYLWSAINLLGERPMSLAILFLLAGGLWIVGQGREGGFFLLTLVPDVVNIGLKDLVARPRPSPELISVLSPGASELSFPSGHVVHFMAFYGLLYFLAPRIIPNALLAGGLRFLAVALIVLVGPARVYAGAHWPSDVLGGYIMGGLFLWAIIALFQWSLPYRVSFRDGLKGLVSKTLGSRSVPPR